MLVAMMPDIGTGAGTMALSGSAILRTMTRKR